MVMFASPTTLSCINNTKSLNKDYMILSLLSLIVLCNFIFLMRYKKTGYKKKFRLSQTSQKQKLGFWKQR